MIFYYTIKGIIYLSSMQICCIGHCKYGILTIKLCNQFKTYLLNANQLHLTHLKVKRNSAVGYYSTFRGLLKIAYCDKLIRENINDFLEKIEKEDVKKQYLKAAFQNAVRHTGIEAGFFL